MGESYGCFGWGGGLQVTILNLSDQHVTVYVPLDDGMIFLSVVYAKCNYQDRRALWQSLKLEILSDEPWLGLGDFNVIRRDEERRGGRPCLQVAMDEFNDFINDCGLRDTQSSVNLFSWHNGQEGLAQSWFKLDQCLLNLVAAELWSDALLHYLPRTYSDHAPMYVEMKSDGSWYGLSSFKFQQMWVSYDGFQALVKDVWQIQFVDSGLFCQTGKLKRLKVALKNWDHRVFGQIDERIHILEARIESLEASLQT